MAGTERPAGAGDILSMSKGDWPRIALHYTLESNGQVLSSGPAQLRDVWFDSTIVKAAGR